MKIIVDLPTYRPDQTELLVQVADALDEGMTSGYLNGYYWELTD